MDNVETEFRPFPSYQDNGDDTPLEDGRPLRYQYAPERGNSRWNHIVDLDSFFTRVYQYHQKHGFKCIITSELCQLGQYIFVVLFAAYMWNCVDYAVLFRDKTVNNSTYKVTFNDAVIPLSQCASNVGFTVIILFIVASALFLLSVARMLYQFFQFLEIKDFYNTALKISEVDLDNMTWHEVQRRLQEVQREQQMCIHKQELTELDIYHRILRHKNYMVAMINKEILPIKIKVPFMDEFVFLSRVLKFNYEFLLLWGWDAPFSQWTLREDYKLFENRTVLARKVASRSFYLGLLNLCLSPLILTWQILYSFFSYGELLKREPGKFGARRWSLYGRIYLRHFNELDHELNARLNRGYRPAVKYMSIFTSHFGAIWARHIGFIAGSLLIVLIVLSVYDEDVLQVDHALTLMTCLGAIIAVSQTLIPDENLVFCPEKLMLAVLAQIHYMPQEWYGNSHTMKVRNEFSRLFQYKLSYLMTELLSPLICPYILMFMVPKNAEKIVDFFRNFTVSVVGVGDVCSFAQMDIRKHGSPQWLSHGQKQNVGFQAQDGKTELSLMHFTLTNPDWRPPNESTAFITQLRERAVRDANNLEVLREENPYYYSLYSLSSLGAEYSSLVGSLMHTNLTQSFAPTAPSATCPKQAMRGGLSQMEGPARGSGAGLLSSLQPVVNSTGSGGDLSLPPIDQRFPAFENLQADFNAADMSFSALYLHQLHHNQVRQDEVARGLWYPQNQPQREMSHIQEATQEEENNETMPLLDLRVVRST